MNVGVTPLGACHAALPATVTPATAAIAVAAKNPARAMTRVVVLVNAAWLPRPFTIFALSCAIAMTSKDSRGFPRT